MHPEMVKIVLFLNHEGVLTRYLEIQEILIMLIYGTNPLLVLLIIRQDIQNLLFIFKYLLFKTVPHYNFSYSSWFLKPRTFKSFSTRLAKPRHTYNTYCREMTPPQLLHYLVLASQGLPDINRVIPVHFVVLQILRPARLFEYLILLVLLNLV